MAIKMWNTKKLVNFEDFLLKLYLNFIPLLEPHQTLSRSPSQTEMDSLDPSDELKGQKTLLNSLHITGIPIDAMKTEDAQIAVLQKLCKKANVSYNKDVDQFYVKNNALIVKFHRLESKDKIRTYAENKDLWTNELLELNKGQDPNRIKVSERISVAVATWDENCDHLSAGVPLYDAILFENVVHRGEIL